ncbi:MAG: response regulator [Legionellales bacterium]|jgi:CheY-like chemotaxis protein
MPNFACYYYPTTIMIVDDEKTYVDSLKLRFKKYFPCKGYTDPKEALNFISNDYHFNSVSNSNRWLLRSKENLMDVKVDLPAIKQEVYNPDRFEQISIIVVDQVMPGLKGLELCRLLGQTDIQKILLTGKVGDAEANDAFNEHLINKFIEKNSPFLIETLTLSIKEKMLAYFENLSRLTMPHIWQNYRLHFFNNLEFIEFFYNFIKENNIVEYYLCEQDRFLFLDADGNPSWFLVKNEKEASREPIKTLQIEGKNYFCTYINDPKAYEIDQDKILSYNKYLKNNN